MSERACNLYLNCKKLDRARSRLEAIEKMALDCRKRNVKVAPQSIMMALRSSEL